MVNAPWFTFTRIDNLGGVEPFGGFPKPDSNIQVPAMYPITALLPGTVTATDGGNVAWGGVVTIKLDVPLNAIATHTAYLHLGAESVGVGQHVSAGQLIGYNGGASAQGSQKVPLGFALYNGPHYGSGSAWSLMTKANLNGGPLDPVPLLDAARFGKLSIPNAPSLYDHLGLISSGNMLPLGNVLPFTTIDNAIQNAITTLPGFEGLVESIDLAEQFQPLKLPTANTTGDNTDYTIFGIDTKIPSPLKSIMLPIDSMQAFLVFVITNTRAAAIRSLLIILGVIILVALVQNLMATNRENMPIDPSTIMSLAGAM